MSTRSSRRTITPSVKAMEVVGNAAAAPATPATQKRTRAKATDFFADPAAAAAEYAAAQAAAAADSSEEPAVAADAIAPTSAVSHSPRHRRSWTHTIGNSGVKEQRLHRREDTPLVASSPALSTRRSTKLDLDLFALDALPSPSPARKRAARAKPSAKKPEPVQEADEEVEATLDDSADTDTDVAAGIDVPAGSFLSSLSAASMEEEVDADTGGDAMLMDETAEAEPAEEIPSMKETKAAKAKTPAKSKQTPAPTPPKSNKRKLALSDDESDEEEQKPSSRFIQPFDEAAEAKKRAEAEAEKKAASERSRYEEADEEEDEDDDGPQEELSFKSSKHAATAQMAVEQAALDAAADAAAKKKAALLATRQKQSALNRAAQLKAAVGGKGKGTAALDVASNLNPDGTLSVAFLDALAKAESEAKKQQQEEAEYARAREEERQEEAEAKRRQKKKPKLPTVKQSGRFTVVLSDPASSLGAASSSSAPSATGANKALYLTQMAYAPITNTSLLNFRTQHLYNNGMLQRQEVGKNYAKAKLAAVQKQAKKGITSGQLYAKQQQFKGGR